MGNQVTSTQSQSPPLPQLTNTPIDTASVETKNQHQLSSVSTAASNPSAPTSPTADPPIQPIQTPTVTQSNKSDYFSWIFGAKNINITKSVPSQPNTTNAATSSLPAASSDTPAPSLLTLAPPPPVLTNTRHVPTTFRAFAPILGGCSLLMIGGVAFGIRYGERYTKRMEEKYHAQEYGEYEVKPAPRGSVLSSLPSPPGVELKEAEPTPEMRRYAVRRAMHAFGLGTALSFSSAALITYGVTRYWEIESIPDLYDKLTRGCARIRMPFETTATQFVDTFNLWIASSWFGKNWTYGDAKPNRPTDPIGLAEVAAQEKEVEELWSEAKRMHEEYMAKKAAEKAKKTT